MGNGRTERATGDCHHLKTGNQEQNNLVYRSFDISEYIHDMPERVRRRIWDTKFKKNTFKVAIVGNKNSVCPLSLGINLTMKIPNQIICVHLAKNDPSKKKKQKKTMFTQCSAYLVHIYLILTSVAHNHILCAFLLQYSTHFKLHVPTLFHQYISYPVFQRFK